MVATSKTAKKLLRSQCNACCKPRGEADFKCCARCKRVYYCSEECQRKAFFMHKDFCKAFAKEQQLHAKVMEMEKMD